MKKVRTEGCPACSSKKAREHSHLGAVVTCEECGALYTTRPIYLGESYSLVLPRFKGTPVSPGADRYFDFETLGSEGIGRRHGWFDPETRLLTQVG